MNQADYIKEAVSIFNSINSHLLKHHFATLNHEIPPKQFMIMKYVYEIRKTKIQDVAEQFNLSMSSVSQLVKKLESDGYVSRSINPDNRRETFLTLGEKGEEYFKEYERVDQYIIDHYYAQLSIDETKQMRDIARKLQGIVMDRQGYDE
ncbi:MarR family transcriptional regulator [Rossellomorea marisflavi]|uniref:MarR family transcriptional regulator n=1 Tax=Rossellomorea marisflavi TaxID=189381 RepID=A0A5D4RJM4_9BACI|nr:MarR family transcriptional regulator [Rossellomorea marisflavi]MDW4528713.1 MarR family transcriptional regulator [Rossellomorea marisflavi]TYS51497.1 MarR family transcriptional regulator [Rossellomorea marisflavi]WJV19042.1 MarR family transcriptional regulator [Rossellomorea marisflavi]